MLSQIPCHLIGGPLGAGKTSLIHALLAQKPAGERWAVLLNEFGRIGLDAALLARDDDGIAFAEVAGGCLCCLNGAPFRVGLTRLLRSSRPDRLLIEPSGLGHPLALLRQLHEAPWRGVLLVQPLLMVLDASALARGESLPDSQQEALGEAGLLVLNKSAGLDDAQRQQLAASLPERPLRWTEQGQLALAELPLIPAPAPAEQALAALPAPPAATATLWQDPRQPIREIQASAEGWAIGWRWHPSQRFDLPAIEHWLQGLAWRRAKLVLRSDDGALAANALDGAPLAWQTSAWRRDSRLELIFASEQAVDTLDAVLRRCLQPAP